MIALITGVVGIISTLLAWNLNPRRKLYAELDNIYAQLEKLYVKRDKALASGDASALVIVVADIIKLRDRKAVLLQRF
jgi:hypothetical protein